MGYSFITRQIQWHARQGYWGGNEVTGALAEPPKSVDIFPTKEEAEAFLSGLGQYEEKWGRWMGANYAQAEVRRIEEANSEKWITPPPNPTTED